MSTETSSDSKLTKDIIVVTGGLGFIGSNFIQYIWDKTDCSILNIDKLTYAANHSNLPDYIRDAPRYREWPKDIVFVDQADPTWKRVKVIFNFAAESHVDRSISGGNPFIRSNIAGTNNLLEIAKQHDIDFFQISTDEIYGSLGLREVPWDEHSPTAPNSVYSASKASAEHLVRAYHRTHDLRGWITRCCNNFGPNQHKEKLIPRTIDKVSKNEKMGIYGNGLQTREWIHVEDHCSAIWTVYTLGEPGTYNVGTGIEINNYNMYSLVCEALGKDHTEHVEWVPDRLGHDTRYAVDFTKLTNLGWTPKCNEDTFREIFQEYVINTSRNE